jgi:hypothetical protein
MNQGGNDADESQIIRASEFIRPGAHGPPDLKAGRKTAARDRIAVINQFS